jgi:PAS domain S-box-containing protein
MESNTNKTVILVVDDNASGLYVTSKILEQNGFDVITASNGSEALLKLKTNPDVVLLDVKLPDIDGFELCRRIKTDPETNNIPVIHLSAIYTDIDSKVAGLESGADGYLTHPVEPKVLKATINSMLRIKRTEEALRQGEEDFRMLFENSFDAIILSTPDGTIQRCNSAAEKLFGYSEDELLKLGRNAVTDPTDPNLLLALAERERTGKFVGVLSQKKKDGTTFFGEVSTLLFTMKDGTVRTSTVVRDMTERIEANNKLLQARKQLQDIIDSAPNVVFAKDSDGKFILCNKKFEELLGTTQEELKGKTDYDLITKILLAGKAQQIEEEADLADGIHHHFIANKFPLFDESGKPYAVCSISTDITQAKKMETALKESEERYRQLADSMPMIIWTALVDGTGDYFNRKWFEYTGVTIEDGLGQGWTKVIHPDDLEHTLETWKKSVETGADYEISYRFRRYDGEYHWFLGRAVAQKDKNGNTVKWYGTSTDIHEQKLAQEKIIRTSEALERSNKELEQFAYVASHDLQEPLRMITSFANLLAMKYKGQLEPKADEYICIITEGAQRMQRLIKDLLTYARITSKTSPSVLIDLNSVIEDVSKDLQLIIFETKTTIKYGHLPALYIDPIQIKQLFQNLIQNSIKFRGEANPVIEINVSQEDSLWTFSIKDNGIGISPDYYEKVFVIFQRLHEKDKYPGTGIGLAICKKIVERHGGRIWVESEIGKGSTFYFTITAEV